MYTILVLEDNVELNQTITYALKKEGYHIFSAHSCKEAEKFTENESFHLTILDVNLPDGDGFQFCKWLKAKKQVPTNKMIYGGKSIIDWFAYHICILTKI